MNRSEVAMISSLLLTLLRWKPLEREPISEFELDLAPVGLDRSDGRRPEPRSHSRR
jgi:hypothetical protein